MMRGIELTSAEASELSFQAVNTGIERECILFFLDMVQLDRIYQETM